MKILHIGAIEPIRSATGPSQSIRGLAKAQADAGMEVGLFCSKVSQGDDAEQIPGVQLLGNIDKACCNPWKIPHKWMKLVKSEFGKPDIVNFHSTYLPFHSGFAVQCLNENLPYIITPRGGMGFLPQRVKHLKKLTANILWYNSYVKKASAIHALCVQEANEIAAQFKTQKIIVVPNGIDEALLNIRPEITAIDLGQWASGNKLILGFIGRVAIFHKGIDVLLKAMRILKSKYGDGYKLYIAGPFHRESDKLSYNEMVDSLGLADIVKYVGVKYGDEKIRCFLACDVFVHTSRHEGMPMSVLEAMALKKPCLVTPGTNMVDIVRRGGGWNCELTAESIAQTVVSIYEQKKDLSKIGLRSHELIRSEFTWASVARQLNEKYMEILNDGKSNR